MHTTCMNILQTFQIEGAISVLVCFLGHPVYQWPFEHAWLRILYRKSLSKILMHVHGPTSACAFFPALGLHSDFRYPLRCYMGVAYNVNQIVLHYAIYLYKSVQKVRNILGK